MFAPQRHEAILNRLQSHGSVRISELAADLEVTEETVRRDLERLDKEGKLQRIHGGAVSHENNKREVSFDMRKSTNLKEKQAMARLAVKHIKDGDIIAVDASTSAYELACILPNMSITLITNSLAVISAVSDKSNINIIHTGGTLDRQSMSHIGFIAEQTLSQLNIGKLFLSCKGVEVKRGLSEASDEHARFKNRMIDLSEHVYVLADHTKFGVKSVVFFRPMRDVTTIITDSQTTPAQMEPYQELGCEFLQAT